MSQKGYIKRILERFGMSKHSPGKVLVQKGDKFNLMQCPKNDVERKEMESIPYASVVGSLMYAQTCTRPDISFAVGMLGRYQSNPGREHWQAAKKVLRYLQGTKYYMLIYSRSNKLKVIRYSDSDIAGCIDTRKSTLVTCLCLLKEPYHGKVQNKLSLLHLLWRQNLWHVMKP